MPIPYVNGALAAIAQPERREKALAAAVADTAPQGHLFERPLSKVIPFESISGARVQPLPVRSMVPPVAPISPRVTNRKAQQTGTVDQPSLDFLPPAPKPARGLPSNGQASIYCDAPVAVPDHRALAGGLDFSVVTIAYALFLGTFWFGGGSFDLQNPTNLIVFGAAFVLILVFYGTLYILGDTETSGMRWTHLRLSNFDGMQPNRKERLLRGIGTLISVFTCGLGLLWTLVDEEKLAWQDHISKTFPTWRQPRA